MKNSILETFLDKWWSTPSSNLSNNLETWIEKSYADVEAFWKEFLFPMQEKILPKTESILAKSYNFYHDCILRHVKSNNVAFCHVKEKDQKDYWSYERLHHCVNFHVEKWSYHSPQQNQLMAIVATPGIHFLISFLTALRFGLRVCFLPINSPYLGKGVIKRILSEIKPDLIAAEDSSFLPEGIPLLTVNEEGSDVEEHNPHSFSYLVDSTLLLTPSLHDPEALKLVTLDAHTVYLHALIDAFFTFNLLQHSQWSAPLSCSIRSEPSSTLMSLLCGVTHIYVDDKDIKKDPSILQDERISLIGISGELHKLWTEFPHVPTRSLKSCFKSPLEISPYAWKSFIQLNRLEKIPYFNALMDNMMAGCTLFSKPTLEPFNYFLKPTLGISWSLSNINGNGEDSRTGFGIFNENFTASVVDKNLMLTGSLEPCREGITFPIFELEKAVNELSFVEVCMVHYIPKADTIFSKCFILLVFVTPMKQALSEKDITSWTADITQKITNQLGSGYLPDQIEYFPLLPKKHILGIDRNWCAGQYDSGLLVRKKELPHYQILSVLKKLVERVTKNHEAVKLIH